MTEEPNSNLPQPISPNSVASLFISARSMWHGARILLERPEYQAIGILELSAHTLLGFAAENYLKAFLMKMGVTNQELRSRVLRHSICALYERAVEMGLSLSGTGFQGIINIIGPGHGAEQDYSNRYLRDITYTKVHPHLVVLVMNDLDTVVGSHLADDLSRHGPLSRLAP